jgi:hypothetical protein
VELCTGILFALNYSEQGSIDKKTEYFEVMADFLRQIPLQLPKVGQVRHILHVLEFRLKEEPDFLKEKNKKPQNRGFSF